MKEPTCQIAADGGRYFMLLPAWETDYIQGMLAERGEPYELTMLQAMGSMLSEQDLVLDVGANIGNHTLYLAVVVGCRVMAFEPNPSLCAPLRESIRLNDVGDRVSLVEKGVGAVEGKGVFAEHTPNNLGGQSLSLLGETSPPDGNIVDVVPLDAMTFDQPVRAIKVDVEGMELDVLKGARALIEKDAPALFVEAQAEEEFEALHALLGEWGYTHWDTFNATPTHWYLPKVAVDLADLRDRDFEHITTMYGQIQERKRLKQELKEAREKYRAANDRIDTLKDQLGKANAKYRQVTKQYRDLKHSRTSNLHED